MKKKTLLTTILLIVIAVFAFSLTACNKEVGTLETLKNEYGIVVDGGSFEEGSTLVSNEIVATTEEATAVLTAIADQNYNKDGNVYIFDIYVTKDGKEVQPDGKVKVSVPVPNVEVDNYLVFHVKDDNSVEKLVPTVADGKISFETSSFSYFVIAEAVIQDAPPIHVHNFEWVEGKESTCKEEGIAPHYHCDGCGKNFDQNYGEIDSIITEKGSHDVEGNYSPRVEPTFFMEGTVAYYICNDCLKYIGEDGQIIPPTDIFIPTLSLEISVCVNGVPTELALRRKLERCAEVDHNRAAGRFDARDVDIGVRDVSHAVRFCKAQAGGSGEVNGFHAAVLRDMLSDGNSHTRHAAAVCQAEDADGNVRRCRLIRRGFLDVTFANHVREVVRVKPVALVDDVAVTVLRDLFVDILAAMPGEDDDDADVRLNFVDSGEQRLAVGRCKLIVCNDQHINIRVKRIKSAGKILRIFKTLIHNADIMPRELHGKLGIDPAAEPQNYVHHKFTSLKYSRQMPPLRSVISS